jgi:hypothetical protein
MASRIVGNHRCLRVFVSLAVVLGLVCIPGAARASNNCPWINEATVSGLLDGEAVGSFSQESGDQSATCKFVYKTAIGTRSLTIHVETVQDAHVRVNSLAAGCAQTPEALPAIGNEAYFCTTAHGREVVTERIVGRVRDQVFTIEISTAGKGDTVLSQEEIKSRISRATEQVSGNLF